MGFMQHVINLPTLNLVHEQSCSTVAPNGVTAFPYQQPLLIVPS